MKDWLKLIGEFVCLVAIGYVMVVIVLAFEVHARMVPNDILQRVRQIEKINKTYPMFPAGVVTFRAGRIDSVKFTPVPKGACDSQSNCEDETDQMCEDAGHGGVDEESVLIVVGQDGSETCSGECENGCNENGCPTALIQCR